VRMTAAGRAQATNGRVILNTSYRTLETDKMSQVEVLTSEDELRRMELEVDRLFKGLMVSKNPLGLLSESVWRPPTDVFETQDEIVILMEIPCVNKEDVSILLVDDVLTIRGRRGDACRDRKVRYHQMEIHYGCFERSFVTPRHIERNAIQPATYSDGFLRIVIPKLSEPDGATPISVKIKL
jgi:HSP20 family protein